jgi:hypothetical protein
VFGKVPRRRPGPAVRQASRVSWDHCECPHATPLVAASSFVLWEGDPVRVSICHCLACQRRTGSVFGVQARFDMEQVRTEGRYSEYVRVSDEGEARIFHFCPECGATVFYTIPSAPELVAVPVGAFADPLFPAPTRSVWESRRHPWLELPEDVEHESE